MVKINLVKSQTLKPYTKQVTDLQSLIKIHWDSFWLLKISKHFDFYEFKSGLTHLDWYNKWYQGWFKLKWHHLVEMGRIWKPQTLTVNCQGESNGVLTFGQTRGGFYDLHKQLMSIVTCLNKNWSLKLLESMQTVLCQTHLLVNCYEGFQW